MAEYRIDDLAREAGTTVRNVRAYQDRGLLPPPRREGRAGIYTDAHLARLQLIGQLLERGYNLANIAELLSALERGHDIAQLLRLEAAIISPWSDEVPSYVTVAELLELFGSASGPEALAEAVALGILELEGERFRVPSPRLLHAGAELVAAGVPLTAVFDHARQMRRDVERIARRFVQLVAVHVFDRYGDGLPSPEDVPRLAEVVQRLRPLAEMVVDAELARAMERSARAHLGERLPHILDHLGQGEAS